MKTLKTIADGVWPTMVTPFTEEGSIDYSNLDALVDWYVERDIAGLFAVCQSSEMFYLSLDERVELARSCVKAAAGRVPVIASGHISNSLEDQIDEVVRMAGTGVQAVVLITNRFAREYESDDVFLSRLERFLTAVPEEILLGFYECPHPYKRLVSPQIMKFGVESGRFGFLKDTSCDLEGIRTKLSVARGSNFRLFNANAATLLESLRAGAAGYSGVMANFHPQLYARLIRTWKTDDAAAEALQSFLGLASVIERQYYPVNAKYALSAAGVPIGTASRHQNPHGLTRAMEMEVDQMVRLSCRFDEEVSGAARRPPATVAGG